MKQRERQGKTHEGREGRGNMQVRKNIFFFETGEKGSHLKRSSNDRTCSGVDRLSQGDEAVMKKGRRTAHGDPRPARISAREQQSAFFLLSFRQCVYMKLTSLVFEVLATCISLMGNDPRNFQGHGIK